MNRKEEWLQKTLQEIRAKDLKEPILIGKHSTITDLEKYLNHYELAIRHTTNRRVLSILCNKLLILKQL